MKFLVASGVVVIPTTQELLETLDGDGRPAVWLRLVREALDFLRAGGRLSASDWAELADVEKDAFVAASRARDGEVALAAARVAEDPAAALAMGASADGGEALKLATMRAATSNALRKVAAGEGSP